MRVEGKECDDWMAIDLGEHTHTHSRLVDEIRSVLQLQVQINASNTFYTCIWMFPVLDIAKKLRKTLIPRVIMHDEKTKELT